jgi:TRAP-type C4-dicarboxylate transport system permease small subunit
VEEGKLKQPLEAVLSAEPLQAIEQEQPGLLARRTSRLSLSTAIDWTLQVLLAVALIGELAVVFLNILSRTFFNSPWLWTNEVAELALATIAFVGGAFVYRRGEHAFIHTFIDALPLKYRRACYALVEFLVLGVALVAGVSSLSFCVARWEQVTPVLQIPAGWFVLPLVPCMVVLVVTAIEHLLAQHRPSVLAVGAPVIALAIVLVLTQEAWKPWIEGDTAGMIMERGGISLRLVRRPYRAYTAGVCKIGGSGVRAAGDLEFGEIESETVEWKGAVPCAGETGPSISPAEDS